jgi:N-acetylmuramoyl-L-alanine amidase
MKSVLISAGHSEVDPGAVGNGVFSNYKEAVMAEKMRDRIFDYLKNRGVEVYRDGDDGVNEPLNKAIALAKKVDLAIEIHFNAGGLTATGIEALCNINKKSVAQKLCGAVASAIDIKIRGDRGWKDPSSGQHHRLGFCEAGGIILEVCFISSAKDMSRYIARKEDVAKYVANTIFLLASE